MYASPSKISEKYSFNIDGLKITVFENVYEPGEDSFLLIELIQGITEKKYTGVDLGCGTGIAGIYALYKGVVDEMIFVDINEYALINTIHNLIQNNFLHKSIVSLNDNLKHIRSSSIDYVFTNPPYLPGIPVDIYEYSLLGGEKGYETVMRFIDESSRILRRDGRLYLIFSSLSGEETILGYLEGKGFNIEHIVRKHYFFEDIIGVEAVKSED